VTVRSGYGEATGKGAAVRVNSGTQVRFSSGNSLQHAVYSAPARDGFEDWAQVRDKRLDDSLSARYVSPGVIGYQDLDANGTWTTTPDYGPVWTPTSVPAGWAPYRYGQWTWIAPWGWTWVDSAPWGFAPFHYGRWVSLRRRLGWAPGSLGYWNPYYAPALVGWIGGPGFGVGFGWGGGWGFGIGIGFGWYPVGMGSAVLSALLWLGTRRLVSRRRICDRRLLPQRQRHQHAYYEHQQRHQQLSQWQFREHQLDREKWCDLGVERSFHVGCGGQQGRRSCAGFRSEQRSHAELGQRQPNQVFGTGWTDAAYQRSVCGVGKSFSCDSGDASGAAGQLQQRSVGDGTRQLELGNCALEYGEPPQCNAQWGGRSEQRA
jgi:hypothetical protein